MFEYKPDFDQVLQRMEEWWAGETRDRALAAVVAPKPPEKRVPFPPARPFADLRERWFDTTFQADLAAARMANSVFLGDALPVVFPNLGPEIFAAFYGCRLDYTETTSWSEPILEDWSDESLARLRIDFKNPYFRKIEEMTDAFIERARGKYIVGYTDLHPGGDALASFRDPQALCLDMLTERERIASLLPRINADFLRVFDHFHTRLQADGMPSSSWLPLTCRGKYHIPSNDFSCMVSDRDFAEVFLPAIAEECRHMDRSIYHLDGPQALRFLDPLLDVPQIHAIQWVYGSGQEPWSRWLEVYRRIQARGKGCWIYGVTPADLDTLFQALEPRHVFVNVSGVKSEEEGREVLRRIERWGR